jgi:hypothetical protein
MDRPHDILNACGHEKGAAEPPLIRRSATDLRTQIQIQGLLSTQLGADVGIRLGRDI